MVAAIIIAYVGLIGVAVATWLTQRDLKHTNQALLDTIAQLFVLNNRLRAKTEAAE